LRSQKELSYNTIITMMKYGTAMMERVLLSFSAKRSGEGVSPDQNQQERHS